eukprot:Lankesteria_metandrocarpae@DN3568_c0_g1_i2.p1
MPSLVSNPLKGVPTPRGPNMDGINQAKDGVTGMLGTTNHGRKELDELLLRVENIERDCETEKRELELAEVRDDFIRLKRSMYNDLMELKDMIRYRHNIQQKSGNTVEAIQKGAKITEKLNALDMDFVKLKEVFKKQTKQKRVNEVELDVRFKDMQILKRQLEESRMLAKSSNQYSDEEIQTITDFRAQMKELGVEIPKAEHRELMDDERDALARWDERDKRLDEGLDDVGNVVDRLGELAITIGEKADRQAVVVQGLTAQANEANEELVEMNTKLKNVLTSAGGVNFFCKLLLAIILVFEVSFLISRITQVIKGS